MRAWQVQEAKAKFSEFLEAVLRDGPQVVTKRGAAAAVMVPMDRWRAMERARRPTLKEMLLAPGARTDELAPPRRRWRHRRPPKLA